jgi:hypothetical protein
MAILSALESVVGTQILADTYVTVETVYSTVTTYTAVKKELIEFVQDDVQHVTVIIRVFLLDLTPAEVHSLIDTSSLDALVTENIRALDACSNGDAVCTVTYDASVYPVVTPAGPGPLE